MIQSFFSVSSNSHFSTVRWMPARLALLAFCAFSQTSLVAQTVDTAILGTVIDSGGGAVAHATVTVTRSGTTLSKEATTGADGAYEFRYLLPGQYVLEVKASGFNAERRSGLDIQLGQQAKVDFTLQVGAVQQTIEVKSAPPLLQTENASLRI